MVGVYVPDAYDDGEFTILHALVAWLHHRLTGPDSLACLVSVLACLLWEREEEIVTGNIPTQIGDVVILTADRAGSTHVVGAISQEDQQDFKSQMNEFWHRATLPSVMV